MEDYKAWMDMKVISRKYGINIRFFVKNVQACVHKDDVNYDSTTTYMRFRKKHSIARLILLHAPPVVS